MTMGTMGCSGAAVGALRGAARPVGLAAACTLGENRGCGSAGADPWTWGRAMSSDLGQFLEACGANGPLRLEWDDWETGRINLEMKATGAGLARPDPGTSTKAATVVDAAANGDPEPGPGAPHPRLVDPEAVPSLVGERLVAWERARRSRRQRVIELLVKR